VNILVLQIFVSFVLVAAGVALFVYTVRSRTLEHSDRLALAPLEDDGPTSDDGGAAGAPRPSTSVAGGEKP